MADKTLAIRKTLATNIKRFREMENITQENLAEKALSLMLVMVLQERSRLTYLVLLSLSALPALLEAKAVPPRSLTFN